jgi:hypothetical protein
MTGRFLRIGAWWMEGRFGGLGWGGGPEINGGEAASVTRCSHRLI